MKREGRWVTAFVCPATWDTLSNEAGRAGIPLKEMHRLALDEWARWADSRRASAARRAERRARCPELDIGTGR